MESDRRLSLTVGGFVVAALGALAVVLLSLSQEQGVFRARYKLVAYFENVQGLVPGAAVWLAGTRVGQVERVEIASMPDGAPAVRVLLHVDDVVGERIRADSVAEIGTVGLLGDQIVQLTIGTMASPMLRDGDQIETRDPFDLNRMVSKGGRALDAIEVLASNLNETLEEFQETGGSRGLARSIEGLSSLVTEVQEGEGALHALIYEPYKGSAVANLEGTTESLANIMVEVEQGDGVLHSLIYDEPAEQDSVLQFVAAGGRLNSILDKIDRGDGTLGLLLNDPTLYEELKVLVGGANRNTIVRSLIEMVTTEEPE